jgi:hypothetical protein
MDTAARKTIVDTEIPRHRGKSWTHEELGRTLIPSPSSTERVAKGRVRGPIYCIVLFATSYDSGRGTGRHSELSASRGFLSRHTSLLSTTS